MFHNELNKNRNRAQTQEIREFALDVFCNTDSVAEADLAESLIYQGIESDEAEVNIHWLEGEIYSIPPVP